MSIASMTGYARAEGHDDQMSWVWEAKSVNGRGLEVRCRVPLGFDGLETAARDTAQRWLKRGNVQMSLTVSRHAEAAPIRVNVALLEQILTVVDQLGGNHPTIGEPRWDGLLALKGVLESVEPEVSDAEGDRAKRDGAIRETLNKALSALSDMRKIEGERLQAVLLSHLDAISTLSDRAAASAALRPEAVRARMTAQLDTLMGMQPPVTEERLAQELAMLAVKGDVREELDRLAAHVAAARDLLAAGGAVGRKLDFLSQEFNREANTLCSKSLDVDLTRIGLDLKAVIDQFREQIQNIE